MCRCSHREWLNGDGRYPLDPHLVSDRLNKVTFFRDGPIDAFWHYLLDFHPQEMLDFRTSQKVYLARYAHVPLDYWEHRELTELRKYYEATGNLVKLENTPRKT